MIDIILDVIQIVLNIITIYCVIKLMKKDNE